MNFIRKKLPALVLIVFVLAACGGQPTEPAEEMDLNALLTSSIGTVSASFFETQTALFTPASPTSTSTTQPTNTAVALVSPTATSTQQFVFVPVTAALSLTPSVTGTQFTPTVNASSLAVGCNNLLLIRDETIPAGSVMKPKETFTKTWKVENNGTCDWALQFRLVFAGGNQMDGDPSGLGKVIPPNKWTQISIQLTAPKQPGTYTGSWRLGTQSGSPFGSTLTVSIVVANPTNTPLPATSTPVPPTSTETPTSTSSPVPSDTPTP